MRIREIKIKTLYAYKDVRFAQLNNKKDKFIDGLEVAYREVLENLGYKEIDLSSQEFIYNEIKKLRLTAEEVEAKLAKTIFGNKQGEGRDCRCERWAIIDKANGNQIGDLGWYTNSSKEEVIKHANNNGIKFEEWEDVRVVEEY